ncbi:Rz1-like lysis system protein LysC [Trinickia symbiotica]|uniref:Rz1-like lysis system protein LysC n=1 Tax=Trinickia symbiotica TaxID=863227 RepID=UPI002159A18C|nr:Rz1-like lysis system protein LysC [Trinickia symbiotica]
MCACKQALHSPAPTTMLNECPAVNQCTLPAMAPRTNGDLDDALTTAKAAWAACAAKVDMIVSCQAMGQQRAVGPRTHE